MGLQMSLGDELVLADAASERTLTSVRAHVGFKVPGF